MLLVELVVQLEEGLAHQDFDHFVKVSGFVKQLGPLPDFAD